MSVVVITLISTVVILAAAVAGMAIGAIVVRKPIQGSCGGLANFKDSEGRSICEACTDPSPECRGERAAAQDSEVEETTAAGH